MNRFAMAVLAGFSLAGCATQVTSGGPAQITSTAMPRPQRVLVSGFTADPASVGLDSGIAARINRQSATARPARERAMLAQGVHNAIVEELLTELTKMGFTAVDGGFGERPRAGDLVLDGSIQKIDQGNRTRRLAVGMGAGRSMVQATANLSYVGANGVPQLLQTYSGESNSGRMPGMAVGVAASAAQDVALPAVASAVMGTRREMKKTGVAGEGQKLADRLSYEMGKYFVAQGWIDPARAPSAGLLQ